MTCHCMKLETIVERNHEIDATDLDGEKVMMDLERGQYFMLNVVAGDVWELISKPMSIDSIVTTLRGEYDVTQEECEAAVKEFLHNMHHANLVTIHA